MCFEIYTRRGNISVIKQQHVMYKKGIFYDILFFLYKKKRVSMKDLTFLYRYFFVSYRIRYDLSIPESSLLQFLLYV